MMSTTVPAIDGSIDEGRVSAADDGSSARRQLTREECLRLLSSGTVGRLARTQGALPHIEMVRHCMVGETLLINVGSPDLARRLIGHVVALESGSSARDRRGAWSVCAVGSVCRAEGSAADDAVVAVYPTLLDGWQETEAASQSL